MERIASREIYWNIPEHLLLYVLLLPFLAVFLYGCYRCFGALLLGRKGVRLGQLSRKMMLNGAIQRPIMARVRRAQLLLLSLCAHSGQSSVARIGSSLLVFILRRRGVAEATISPTPAAKNTNQTGNRPLKRSLFLGD